jgi:mono/diheme cytochrome c family protein
MTRKIASFGMFLMLCASAQTPKPVPSETTPLIGSIQGPDLFRAYCAVCHGMDGKGTGVMAKSLKTKVPDLTGLQWRNGGKPILQRVQKIISGEEQLPRGHGTTEMPMWGPIFSRVTRDQDLGRVRIDNLARYIEGLQKK